MKRILQTCLSIILLILISDSCLKDNIEPTVIKEKITGFAQKGPFIIGTSISMSEMNSSLEQTGKIFTTQIIKNNGSFEINKIKLISGFVEISANGYYFDEVKGDLSIAPLYLVALSNIQDISTVNVNVMTHLEKFRIEYLVKQKKTYSEAKKTAQKEILAIFGFAPDKMDDSETLDISVNEEDNAILLAISIILLGNRSVGDLTELLANISNNIREHGVLNNDTIIDELIYQTKHLNLSSIRTNLKNRYQELGLNVTIPGFEKYINDFLAFTGKRAPTVITKEATFVQMKSATLNGSVNPNYLSTTVTFEWGTTESYGHTVAASQSPVTGSSPVNVSAGLTGLSQGTTYHFRIKAENSLGTRYGSNMKFTTLLPLRDIVFNPKVAYGSLSDNDGNTYKTVTIGTQTWMAENLKTTRLNDGTAIPLVTEAIAWYNLSTPSYCWYNNDESYYKAVYGGLYNWYTVNTGKLCPTGWHIPSYADWSALVSTLGGENIAGGKLKEIETIHWNSPNSGATNESGFSAIPVGNRWGTNGIFEPIGAKGYWWVNGEKDLTCAYIFILDKSNSSAIIGYGTKRNGFSIRCLKD